MHLREALKAQLRAFAGKAKATPDRQLNSVTVGLDFGTSTTKCILNLEGVDSGRDRFVAFVFPSAVSKEGMLCIPTAIALDKRSLVFGEEADALPEDVVIRSFKMALPCMGGSWRSYASPFMVQNSPGHFEILGSVFSAEDLVILYLAVVLRQIIATVTRDMPRGQRCRIYVNLAAPLDQLASYYERAEHASPDIRRRMDLRNADRDTDLSRRYMAIGQRALRLCRAARNPWGVQNALAALQEVRQTPLLPTEKSPAYVIPETLAAITGFVNRPGTRMGRFMTLDVGAGSTDVSVFWLQKNDGQIKPWYYASRSLHVGMDDVDSRLVGITSRFKGQSRRVRREAFERRHGGLDACLDQCADVIERIDKHRFETFGRAYRKERRQSAWGDAQQANVQLLMMGGGCRSDAIGELCKSALWKAVIGPPDSTVLDLDRTAAVLLPNGEVHPLAATQSLAQQSALLVIAEGLANKIIDIPEYGIEIEPVFEPRHYEPQTPDHWWGDR